MGADADAGEDMTAYVYEHWRPDLGKPFWVGKGTGRRSHVMRRNKHHGNIVKKLATLGLEVVVKIVADNLTEEEAFSLEIERMEFWRAQGVRLSNQSVGGRGGMAGVKRSEESRRKQSETNTGRKRTEDQKAKNIAWLRSPEGRAKISNIHTGMKRPPGTGEKISVGTKLAWSNPDIRARRLATLVPFQFTDEIRQKMRDKKTPQARARLAEIVRKKWQDPEFKKRASEAMVRAAAKRKMTCDA